MANQRAICTRGYKILNDDGFAIKGNDMKLFHYPTAGPHIINYAFHKLLMILKI